MPGQDHVQGELYPLLVAQADTELFALATDFDALGLNIAPAEGPDGDHGNVLWLPLNILQQFQSMSLAMWSDQDQQCVDEAAKAFEVSAYIRPTGQDDDPATDISTLTAGAQKSFLKCCPDPGDSTAGAAVKGGAAKLSSTLLTEVFLAHTQLGVFFDELGAFNASLKHFRRALSLCGPRSGLLQRIAFAVPTVFSSQSDMQLTIDGLQAAAALLLASDPGSNPGVGRRGAAAPLVEPQRGADLAWSVTPPTMFVWCVYDSHNAI